MRTFIHVISKLKWVGLLGLPLFFSDWVVWKWFWLFWLFGIVELFLQLPLFAQSLLQLLGMATVPLRNKPMPDTDHPQPDTVFSLPFDGPWVAVNGGVTKADSHSWEIPSQRYAYDFIILNDAGQSYKDDARVLTEYYCYNQPILASADGTVIQVKRDCRDSIVMGGGKTDPLIKDIRGNFIVMQHSNRTYSLLAHLKPGSIAVSPGDVVERGQVVAACGNSGNTSEPHLHFQVQNSPSFYFSAGLPIYFEHLCKRPSPNYEAYDPRPVATKNRDEAHHITRGQLVENTRPTVGGNATDRQNTVLNRKDADCK